MKAQRIAAGALLAAIGIAAHAASLDLSLGPYSAKADKFSNAAFTDVYDFNFDRFSIVVNGRAIGDGTNAFQPGFKGSYSPSVAAQPVPKPQTYALMLAGLGVVGFVAFRRRVDRR